MFPCHKTNDFIVGMYTKLIIKFTELFIAGHDKLCGNGGSKNEINNFFWLRIFVEYDVRERRKIK
jgi:hypothetical protein